MTVDTSIQTDVRLCSERVVVLGASNVAMSLSRLIYSIRDVVPHDTYLKMLFACGHGRSYGQYSNVLVRKLPGILNCGLWSVLEQIQRMEPTDSPYRLKAILTDVGNDLVYGVPVPRILDWVERCLIRLKKHDADLVMTGLPVHSLSRLSPLRYTLTQKLFFPKNSSTHKMMVGWAMELNEQLERLSEKYEADFIEEPRDWFGFDPIHFKHHQRARIWKKFCSHWDDFDVNRSSWRGHWLDMLAVWNWKPAQRWWCGKSQSASQPCFDADRTKVYLF
ncbi:MAG: hypothetical protein R3C11_04600 [Planctomycetaceae bacterium]